MEEAVDGVVEVFRGGGEGGEVEVGSDAAVAEEFEGQGVGDVDDGLVEEVWELGGGEFGADVVEFFI